MVQPRRLSADQREGGPSGTLLARDAMPEQPPRMTRLEGVSAGVRALAAAHRNGQRTVPDTVEQLIDALEASSDVAIWISREAPESLRARADELTRGPRDLPLLGVPFAVKDNIDVAGRPTTAGCPDFAYEPQETAFVVRRLLAAGAILVGKTNLDQFATGLVGTRTPYGACSSVFSPDHVSGGSSSGSAVAVARGLVGFALGTDTAGSGRVPAAFNELVGVKPTRGLVSTAGVVPACRTLDCVTIFARDAEDGAAVLDVAAAYDPEDAFARDAPRVPSTPGARPAVLGLPRAADLEFFGDDASARAWARTCARAGAVADRLVEVDLAPFIEAGSLLYEGPWVAERYAAVGPFLEREDVRADPTVRTIILRGAAPSAAAAFTAQYRLAELRRQAEQLFAQIDALVVPTTTTFPTHADVAAEPIAANARLGTYMNFVNLLDLAAVAVPGARRADGLPFGVTLIAPAFADDALLRLATAWASGQHTDAADLELAVVGAHMSGMPRNSELLELGARLVRSAETAACYRLFDLDDGTGRPGLVRTNDGVNVEAEVWRLTPAALGELLARVDAPLAIGSVELDDGSIVKGFVCEPHALDGARDVTGFGGWRAYTAAAAQDA